MALRILAASTPDGPAGADADRLLEDAILEGLDPALEKAAGVLAVLRTRIDRPALLGVPVSTARQLVRRGLASRDGSGLALHDLVRETLLPRLSPAALRAGHRAAAKAALGRGDGIEAAYHLLESGQPLRAREALLERGTDLVDSPAVGEVVRLLQRLPPNPRARLVLATGLDRLGRSREAREALEPILSRPGHRLRPEALLLLGRIASRANALGEARARIEEAIALAANRGDARVEGTARRLLAVVLRKSGDLEAAGAELDRAVPILEAASESRELVRARLDRAILRLQRGDLREAGTEFEAVASDPAAGLREGAVALSNLAIVRARGNAAPAEVADLCERAAGAAERGGDFRAAGYALANAADAYLSAGRLPAAESAVRRAWDLASPFADPLLESTILTNEGKVFAAQGRTEEAEDRLVAGVERIRNTGNVLSLIERVHELAAFYESAGRADDARRWRLESEGLRRNGPRGPPDGAGP